MKSALLLFTALFGFAALPGLAPRAQAQSGPTLDVTVQFIQEKLNSLGKVNLVAFNHDSSNNSDYSINKSFEASNVSYDANAKQFNFHWNEWINGTQTQNKDAGFNLVHVQNVLVKSYNDYQLDINAKAGKPNLVPTSTTPPITVMIVYRDDNDDNAFFFTDSTLADRVARAINHAVELVGGGNKEPF